MNRVKTVTIDWLPGKPVATYNYKPQEPEVLDNIITFNGINTTYSFDGAHRLTDITSPVASYSFSLDGNGNRTGVTQTEPLDTVPPPVTTGYNYNTARNRLSNTGGNSFGYDNEGQLNSGYGSSYTFDYEHRLTAISGVASYAYDGAGNRLQAIRDGVTTRYIYDVRGNLLAEADSSNTITRYYIHGVGLLAMVTPTNETYCYHYNATGSTVAMTDQGQTMVNKYAYDPFGNIVNQEEALPQPFKYVGQFGVMSEPNGFYYMRARYYDPNVGRFISEDPAGFGGGDVNLMAYVGSQPVNGIDPSGLWTVSLGVNLSGYLGAIGGGGGTSLNIGFSQGSGFSASLTGTFGGGAATGVGGGLGITLSGTNASSVNDLLGSSVEASRAVGTALTLTGIAGNGYQGGGVTIGLGGIKSPVTNPQGGGAVTSTSAIAQFVQNGTSGFLLSGSAK